MRWATYVSPTDQRERVGLLQDAMIHGLRRPCRLLDLLEEDGLQAAGRAARTDPLEVLAVEQVVLRAPVPRPPSIRDFMSFESHVSSSMRAMGQDIDPGWYEQPVFYFSNPAATRGPNDDIAISPGSEKFDYELEVAVVVGRAGSDLSAHDASEHIAGYVVLCDWSARDLQEQEMRQRLGPAKGKDSATSLSGCLVTPDELEPFRRGHSLDLAMRATVNGTLYSEGNLADIHWSFAEMLAYASRGTTVLPGDVIGSGTVGSGCILELSRVHGLERYPYLKPGDEVHLEVDQIGSVRSRITAAGPLTPWARSA